MRYARLIAIAVFFLTLGGCVVVPTEPVVYGPPAAAVVVQPTFGYSYHGYRRHWHRRHGHGYWR